MRRCPITYTQFIHESQLNTIDPKDYQISQGRYQGFALVTSTTVNNNLPYQATKLQYKACAQDDHEASFPGECFYEFERQKSVYCGEDPQTGYKEDGRFADTNLRSTEWDLEYQSGILRGLQRQPGYTTNGARGCPNYASIKQSEANIGFIRPNLPWSLQCEAEGLDRKVAWGIAASIKLDTSVLGWMIGFSVATWVAEPIIVYCFIKQKQLIAFVFHCLQFIFLIVFAGQYIRTDRMYQKLMADSAQLSDFNKCGDSYMKIDLDTVMQNIYTSKQQLQVGLYFAIIAVIAYATKSFALIMLYLQNTRPGY